MRKIEKAIDVIIKNAGKNGMKAFWFKDGEYIYITDGHQVIMTREIDGVNGCSELSDLGKRFILESFKNIPADPKSITSNLDQFPKHADMKAKIKEIKAAYKERTGAKRKQIVIGFRADAFMVNAEYLLNAFSIVKPEFCVSGPNWNDPILLLSENDDTNYLILPRNDHRNHLGFYAGELIPGNKLQNVMTEHDLKEVSQEMQECA